ncbi:E3 ubiquitin-protein ligase synoviolin B-like isoform X2 [Dysidea avara]
MERSPVITLKFHARAFSLLLALGTVDAFLLHYAFNSVIGQGPSVQLVFGLEYAILLIMLVGTAMKYILHTIDLQNENPWENKMVYMLYTDVVLGFLKVSLYFAFMSFMIMVHMFPLYIMRRTYLSVKAFKKSVSDVVLSRKAIANLNRYPDVTPEELQNVDNVCIICREEMTAQAKKLPCNHIFHLSCLRSWFQRQQTCPTCRESVLKRHPPPPTAPRQPHAAPPGNNPMGAADRPPFPPAGFPPPPPMMWPGMIPPQAAPPMPQAPPTQPPAAATADQPHTQDGVAPETNNGPTAVGAVPTPTGTAAFPPFMMPPPPPPPPFPPFFMPGMFPNMGAVPPPNLAALSEEELRQLEGMERHNVEARIKLLQRIQSLLDSAVSLMGQYSSIAPPMSEPVSMPQAASVGNFVSQASQPEDYPVQSSSHLLESAATNLIPSKSEGIQVNKILPAEDEEEKTTVIQTSDEVDTKPADSSEIRKKRLERLTSKEATYQQSIEATQDDDVTDT